MAEEWPSKVLPVRVISGRDDAKALSIKKYSCSQPKDEVTFLTFLSKYFATSVAAVSIAVNALNKGVLLSKASPVYDTKTVGIQDNNLRVRGENDPHANEESGKYEPVSPYDPTYPYNHVYETESGHVKEYDDTPGYERIKERHKSGTQYEIQPNGSKIEKIVRDNYQLVVGHDTLEVRGNVKIIVSGDANIAVAKNLTAQVGQDMTTIVGGNMEANITGTTSLTGIGDISITQNGIDASLITLKSEYTKDDIVYKGNIKLDGEVSITENLVVEKLTTTSNSTTPIELDTHTHDDFDSPTVQTGTPN